MVNVASRARSSAWTPEQLRPKEKVEGSNPSGLVEGLRSNPFVFLWTGRLLSVLIKLFLKV